MTPVQQLAELGCFRVPVVAAHGIYVDAADSRLLREGGVSVAHNPGSNLKLANGIAPVQILLEHGVNVSLGTDGAASNNNLNLFEEMHLAALLQKWLRRDAEALPARKCCAWRRSTARRHSGSIRRSARSRSASRRTSSSSMRRGRISLRATTRSRCSFIRRSRRRLYRARRRTNSLEDRELLTLDEDALLAQATEQTHGLLHRAQGRKGAHAPGSPAFGKNSCSPPIL